MDVFAEIVDGSLISVAYIIRKTLHIKYFRICFSAYNFM